MKNTILKKSLALSILSLISLSALANNGAIVVTTAESYGNGVRMESALREITDYITKVAVSSNNLFDKFLDKRDKRPFGAFVSELSQIIQSLKQEIAKLDSLIQATKSDADCTILETTKNVFLDILAQLEHAHFGLNKYSNKGPGDALKVSLGLKKLKAKLNSDANFRKLDQKISQTIGVLKTQYPDIAKTVAVFRKELHNARNEGNTMSGMAAMSAIRHRLKCA